MELPEPVANIIDFSLEEVSAYTANHIRAWGSEHGSLPEGWLLVRTGWDNRSQNRESFLNKDDDGDPPGSLSNAPSGSPKKPPCPVLAWKQWASMPAPRLTAGESVKASPGYLTGRRGPGKCIAPDPFACHRTRHERMAGQESAAFRHRNEDPNAQGADHRKERHAPARPRPCCHPIDRP
ncbi:cyclase family protein [Arthrobacter sp. 2MCAF14]